MHLPRHWIDRRVYEYFAVHVGPRIGWRDPILVYQMGKVGSSSIRNALFRCRSPRTRVVLMSHEFLPVRHRDPERLDLPEALQAFARREIEHERRAYARLSRRERIGLRFREKCYAERILTAYVRRGGPLRVITPVRDPLATNVSMFFQLRHQFGGAGLDRADYDVDEDIDVFLREYTHSRPLTWFDAELRPMLGIDVFRHPFPAERGHDVIAKGETRLLLLKSELDDAVKARVVGDFVGVEGFAMVRSNVTSRKPFAERYAEFTRRLRVPEPLLDTLYHSTFARHFYTLAERERFRARWQGRTARG